MAILPNPGENKLPAEIKPIGGLQVLPASVMGTNTPGDIGVRRGMTLDDSGRITAQLQHDRGVYSRPPIGPVEYGEGNIKKSTELTGVAGYNQRQIPLKDSADDMSQLQYMASVAANTPKHRELLRNLTLGQGQYFLNTQQISDNKTVTTHNSPTNLMALAKVKAQKQIASNG